MDAGRLEKNAKTVSCRHWIIILMLLIIAISSGRILAYADDYEYQVQNGITWKLLDYDDGYMFCGCDRIPEDGAVDIPAVINGKDVVAVGAKALRNNTEIKELYIPDSVGQLYGSSFEGCTSLKKIRLPQGVKEIPVGLLKGCSALSDIRIPDSVTSIQGDAFRGCSSIETLTLPAGLASLNEILAFSDCTGLKEIKVDPGNTAYTDVDGVLFTKDGSRLLKYPEGKADERYEMPQSVRKISEGAFSGAQFKGINLIPGIREIPVDCFYDTKNLTDITVPEGVVKIGDNAFYGCRSLKHIELPDGLKSIGEHAFCFTGFKEIDIPDSVSTIGRGAFSNASIGVVELPESLTKLEDYLFDSSAVKAVWIPESVKKIGNNPFRYAGLLECVYIPSSVEAVDGTYDSDILFSTIGKKVTVYGSDGSFIQSYLSENDISSAEFDDSGSEGYIKAVENLNGHESGTGGENSGNTDPGTNDNDQSGSTDANGDGNNAGGNNASEEQHTENIGSSPGDIKSAANQQVTAVTTVSTVSLARPKLKAKNKKGRKIKLSWNRVDGADGYMLFVKCPGDKRFICRITKGARVKSITHKGLLKGKKYKYRIVPYKIVDGQKIQGAPSKTKTIKVKR